jgi:hypothetical protein
MRKLFNDKYASLILRKGISIGPIFHTEEEIINGLNRNNIIKNGNNIIFHDLMGNVVYEGSDYIYKRFSIRAFLRIKYLEREDRKIEKDKEKYKRFKSFGIRIKGTNKRVRVKPELVDSDRIYFPPVKSLPRDCVIQNGDKIKIIYIDKDGKRYTGGASSGYEIIDIN